MTDNEFKTHHIAMTTDFIETDKPTTILISGSPSRTREIYDKLDIKEKLVETGRALPIGKGFLERTINDEEHKIAVVVGTTGMGFGTTEIVTNEIVDTYAQSIREQNIGLDVQINANPLNIFRVGTSGSHQPHVYGGDVVIASETSVPFGTLSDFVETEHDSALFHFKYGSLLTLEKALTTAQVIPGIQKSVSKLLKKVKYALSSAEVTQSFPSDSDLASYAIEAAQVLGIDKEFVHYGQVFSKLTLFSELSDLFTINAEGLREDRLDYRGKVMHENEVHCSEMEIGLMSAIIHQAKKLGYNIKIGGVMGVINNPREKSEAALFGGEELEKTAVERAMNVALETAVQAYKHQHLYKNRCISER